MLVGTVYELTVLRDAGFSRRVARRTPPISERNRILHLTWAIEHVGWTLEQWKKILWSDETWINSDGYTKTYVTCRVGEEWDPTCIVERIQRRKGWMLWNCFHGVTKEPSPFWEKNGILYPKRAIEHTLYLLLKIRYVLTLLKVFNLCKIALLHLLHEVLSQIYVKEALFAWNGPPIP